jgi:hypothetical protein
MMIQIWYDGLEGTIIVIYYTRPNNCRTILVLSSAGALLLLCEHGDMWRNRDQYGYRRRGNFSLRSKKPRTPRSEPHIRARSNLICVEVLMW